MSYTIYKSDGTAVTVPDNTIDIAFYNPSGGTGGNGLGTQLLGRNTINYGAAVAQNFLQMTENFASLAVPSDTTSLQGQLWFSKTSSTTGILYVRTTSNGSGGILNWREVVTADADGNITIRGGTGPAVNPTDPPEDGDIQVVGSVISIWANSAWQQVFPAEYS